MGEIKLGLLAAELAGMIEVNVNASFLSLNGKKKSRLSKLLQQGKGHPLTHLLFILFSGLKPEEFFNHQLDLYKPFGSGPWPCLNHYADHFCEPVIDTCNVTFDKDGILTGEFKCSTCGFHFIRRSPDRSPQDLFRVDKIKYGKYSTDRTWFVAYGKGPHEVYEGKLITTWRKNMLEEKRHGLNTTESPNVTMT